MCRALLAALTLASAPAFAADPAAVAAGAYSIETAGSTARVGSGQEGKLVVVIQATAAGWHVHPQAPVKVKFRAPPGLKLAKAELSRRDAVNPGAESPRFEAPFVATAAGRQEARADVDFFICSADACVKQTRTVTIAVDVQ